jgi:hypothetical protein
VELGEPDPRRALMIGDEESGGRECARIARPLSHQLLNLHPFSGRGGAKRRSAVGRWTGVVFRCLRSRGFERAEGFTYHQEKWPAAQCAIQAHRPHGSWLPGRAPAGVLCSQSSVEGKRNAKSKRQAARAWHGVGDCLLHAAGCRVSRLVCARFHAVRRPALRETACFARVLRWWLIVSPASCSPRARQDHGVCSQRARA